MKSVSKRNNKRDQELLEKHLLSDVEADFGPARSQVFILRQKDRQGNLLAGLQAKRMWSWLYIRCFGWPPSPRSREGFAAFGKSREKARVWKCTGIWVDTMNPEAVQLYLKAGFRKFGQLENHPKPHGRTFLKKKLS